MSFAVLIKTEYVMHPHPYCKCLKLVLTQSQYGNRLECKDAKIVGEKENNAAGGADSTLVDGPRP